MYLLYPPHWFQAGHGRNVRTTTVPDGLLILAEQHSVAVLEWLALMPYSEKVLDLD